MNEKSRKILENLRNKKVGVFYDGANVYHAQKKYKLKVDLKEFKDFINQHCDLEFVNYYLSIPAKNDNAYQGIQGFLDKIKDLFNIKSKELKYIPVGKQVVKKGNMDIEIVLDVVRNIDNLDVVIIVSGDSDFFELKKYVVNEKKKIIIFWAFEKNMAWELKYCWHLYLDDYKNEFLKRIDGFE